MKRTLLLLTSLTIIATLCFMITVAMASTKDIEYLKFCGDLVEDNIMYTTFEYDDSYLFKPNDYINYDLAKASIALSSAASLKYLNKEHASVWRTLVNMSFDENHMDDINYSRQSFTDDNHFVAATFAHKVIIDSGGKEWDLFVIVIRGTVDYEWLSNFTIGTNGSFHIGYRVAEQEILDEFLDFYNRQESQGNLADSDISNNKIWITGHGRGGAVANLLAAESAIRNHASSNQIYAYTFACPGVTTLSTSGTNYQGIFNFNSSDDLISRVPQESLGFEPYGTKIELFDDFKDQMAKKFAWRYYSGYITTLTAAKFVYSDLYPTTKTEDILATYAEMASTIGAYYSCNITDDEIWHDYFYHFVPDFSLDGYKWECIKELTLFIPTLVKYGVNVIVSYIGTALTAKDIFDYIVENGSSPADLYIAIGYYMANPGFISELILRIQEYAHSDKELNLSQIFVFDQWFGNVGTIIAAHSYTTYLAYMDAFAEQAEALTAPVLLAPTNGNSDISNKTITFEWSDTNADQYKIWFTNQTTGEIISKTIDGSKTSYTYTFSNLGNYSWMMCSCQGQMMSCLSSTTFFTIVDATPASYAVPFVKTPLNNASFTKGDMINFSWGSTGAPQYKIILTNTSDGEIIIPDLIDGDTTSYTNDTLSVGTWSWQVASYHDGITDTYSSSLVFTVEPVLETPTSGTTGAPTLLDPIDYTEITASETYRFSWTAVSGASYYHLKLYEFDEDGKSVDMGGYKTQDASPYQDVYWLKTRGTGTFGWRVACLDANENEYAISFQGRFVVNPAPEEPDITDSSPLPDGIVGEAYSYRLTATGDQPIEWSITSGSLPIGISLVGDTITGTPTEQGTVSVRIQAKNDVDDDRKTFELTIKPTPIPPEITTETTLPDGQVGATYSCELTATSDTPITWSLGDYGNLPAGLTLTENIIGGQPATQGTTSFTIVAQNDSDIDIKQFTITINPDPGITTSNLPTGMVGEAYSCTITAIGTQPIVWSILDGVGLPDGLTLTGDTISGTPTSAGLYDFSVVATNAVSKDIQVFSILINAVPVKPDITTIEMPDGIVGDLYLYPLAATGDRPIAWSIDSGTLPDGLELKNNVISGTPSEDGTTTFSIMAQNEASSDTQELSITINAALVAPEITTKSLPDGMVGTVYSQLLAATGTEPISWSLDIDDSLPVELNLNGNVISGTPTEQGITTFAIIAENATGEDKKQFSINVLPEDNSLIAINETTFPDPNFRAIVLSDYSDGNGNVDTAVRQIVVNGQSIKDLTGLAYFTALETLDCSENQLSLLEITANTALITLNCWDNQLSTLDVSSNSMLQNLICGENQLATLDVASNMQLRRLSCWENQLTSLNVTGNIQLVTLDCSYNQLTMLDISQNTSLAWLYCSGNNLTALDVSANTALITLHCYANQLTALDVCSNTVLKYLSCGNNLLTALDVSKLVLLESLYCSGNRLSSLDLTYNTNLLNDSELSGQAPASITSTLSGGIYHVDLTELPNGNQIDMTRVTITDGGALDTSMGIVTYNSKPDSVTYNYDTQAPSDNPMMDVTIHNVVPSEYVITSEHGDTWMPGNEDGLIFKGTGALMDLSNVLVDNVLLTQNTHYTAQSGSTIITLLPTYLDTLSAGNHEITMQWGSKEATKPFIVSASSLIYTEDFESYALGVLPAGWEIIYSGEGTSKQVVVSENDSQCLAVDGRSGWSAVLRHKYTSSSQQITANFDACAVSVPGGGKVGNGTLYAGVGIQVGWHHYRLVIDYGAESSNVYVDGELYSENGLSVPDSSWGSYMQAACIAFDSVNSSNSCLLYIDNIMLYTTDTAEPAPDPGDANGDGTVDIMDLVNIIDYIVNGTESTSLTGADANGDGSVDIMDLVYIIDQIVNGSVASAMQVNAASLDASSREVEIEVPFSSSVPITALEVSYTLSQGLTFVSADCSNMTGTGGSTNAVFINLSGGVTSGTVTLRVRVDEGVTEKQFVTVTAVTGANTVGTCSVGIAQVYNVSVEAPPSLVILNQPVNTTVVVDSQGVFTVEAGGAEPLTYQWYINRNDGSGWVRTTNGTQAQYITSPVTLEDDGYQYSCRVTDANNAFIDSVIVTLTVVTSPQTGDNSHPIWMITMTVIAITSAFILMRFRKRYGL